MARYRKKPVEVDAMQWTGRNMRQLWHWAGADAIHGPTDDNPGQLGVTTIHGEMAIARPGDWIIAEPTPGRFHPCEPDIFAATYEPVS